MLEEKIILPRYTTVYKSCKLFRLVKIIQEATRLLARHHGLLVNGVDCTRKHEYKTTGFFKALYIATRYRIQHYDEYWLLEC